MTGNWIIEEARRPVDDGKVKFALKETGDGIRSGKGHVERCALERFGEEVGRGGSV